MLMNTKKIITFMVLITACNFLNVAAMESDSYLPDAPIPERQEYPDPIFYSSFVKAIYPLAKKYFEPPCPEDCKLSFAQKPGTIKRNSHGAKHAINTALGTAYLLDFVNRHETDNQIVEQVVTDPIQKRIVLFAASLHDSFRDSDNGADTPEERFASKECAQTIFANAGVSNEWATDYSNIILHTERDAGNILALIVDGADQADVIRTRGETWWADSRDSRYFDLSHSRLLQRFQDNPEAHAELVRFYEGFVQLLKLQHDLFYPSPIGQEEITILESLKQKYNIQKIGAGLRDRKAIQAAKTKYWRTDKNECFLRKAFAGKNITADEKSFINKIDMFYSLEKRQQDELDPDGGLKQESFFKFEADFKQLVNYAKHEDRTLFEKAERLQEASFMERPEAVEK